MNQKSPHPAEPVPEYLHEVRVNGRRLIKGMEASLPKGRSGIAGRYEFRYGEVMRGQRVTLTDGGLVPEGPVEEILMLTFYGPVRRVKQRFRTVRAGDVLTVHSKTEARS